MEDEYKSYVLYRMVLLSMTLSDPDPLSSIVIMHLLPFPRYSRILVQNRYPLVFGAPVGGEAVRFEQRPLVTKN